MKSPSHNRFIHEQPKTPEDKKKFAREVLGVKRKPGKSKKTADNDSDDDSDGGDID